METFNTHSIKQCVCVCVCVCVCQVFSILQLLSVLYLPFATGPGSPYLHNKHDQWIYPLAGHTHPHTHTHCLTKTKSISQWHDSDEQPRSLGSFEGQGYYYSRQRSAISERNPAASFLGWSDLKLRVLSVWQSWSVIRLASWMCVFLPSAWYQKRSYYCSWPPAAGKYSTVHYTQNGVASTRRLIKLTFTKSSVLLSFTIIHASFFSQCTNLFLRPSGKKLQFNM